MLFSFLKSLDPYDHFIADLHWHKKLCTFILSSNSIQLYCLEFLRVLQEGLFHGMQNHVGVDAVHEACKHNLMHTKTIKFKIKHEDYQTQN